MALCLIAGIHASRDLEQDAGPCSCVHCAGFCSCESNTGADHPRGELVKCPRCGHAQQVKEEELEFDPQCGACGEYLGAQPSGLPPEAEEAARELGISYETTHQVRREIR